MREIMKIFSSTHRRPAARIGALLLSICILTAGVMAPLSAADEADSKAALSAVKKMIASIKSGLDDRALTYVGLDQISAYLLDKNYKKMSAEDLAHFRKDLGEFIQLRAFPLVVKYIDIGSVGFSLDKPTFKKGKAYIKSSITWRASEQSTFTWVLEKVDGKYLVVDLLNIKGQSSMKANRDKQVLPLYRKGGAKLVLKKFDQLVTKLKKSKK